MHRVSFLRSRSQPIESAESTESACAAATQYSRANNGDNNANRANAIDGPSSFLSLLPLFRRAPRRNRSLLAFSARRATKQRRGKMKFSLDFHANLRLVHRETRRFSRVNNERWERTPFPSSRLGCVCISLARLCRASTDSHIPGCRKLNRTDNHERDRCT